MRKINKNIIRLITFLVVSAFLSQQFAWAEGPSFLRADSNNFLKKFGETVRNRPGAEDDEWEEFNGNDPCGMAVPFFISEGLVQQLQSKFGDFGPLEGEVGADGKAYFPMPAEVSRRLGKVSILKLKQRIDWLLEKLKVFGPGTKIRINTSGAKPLFYNKDDNSLDIHGVLLLDGAPDLLLLFCGFHDARHKQISGLSPVFEEILNIYMDFEYLDALPAQESIALINELERMEKDKRYSGLLRRRFDRKQSPRKQDELFEEVLNYISDNCLCIMDKIGKKSTAELRRMLEKEPESALSPLNILISGARFRYEGFPEEIPRSVHRLVPQLSSFLFKNIDYFETLQDEQYMLRRKCGTEPKSIDEIAGELGLNKSWVGVLIDRDEDIVRVLYPENKVKFFSREMAETWSKEERLVYGYDSATGKGIYIPAEYREQKWAESYIHDAKINNLWTELRELLQEKFSDKALRDIESICDFLKGERIDEALLENQLKTAIRMVRAGAGIEGIAASLIYALDIKIARIRGLSRDVYPGIDEVINCYDSINNIFSYTLNPNRHMIQNVINLIIQISKGSPDVLFLLLIDKLQYLNRLAENPDEYNSLSEEEKEKLKVQVEYIYTPLAGFLGRDDLAEEMRDLYLKASEEYYRLWLEEVCRLAGLGHLDYDELKTINDRIVDIVKDVLEGLPVEARGRVKSVHSAYHKPREIKDMFGIQLVITGRHTMAKEMEIRGEISGRLEKLFIFEEPDKKKLIEKKYNEYDFIAELRSEYNPFSELFEEYGINRLSLEVQLYPTEDDYQLYMYGPPAHWLYRLESFIKEPDSGIIPQAFDRDTLARIYRRKKRGDLENNLRVIYNELKKWKYTGVVDEGRLYIVRAAQESIPADIVSAPGVNLFNDSFFGLARIETHGLAISNFNPEKLLPGIYVVVNGSLDEEALTKIRDISKKPRTILLASELLGERISPDSGRNLLEKCLAQLGGKIRSRAFLEDKLFTILDEYGRHIGLVYKAFSLSGLDEFYKILVLANKPGKEGLLIELVRRTYYYMTGEELDEMETPDSLRNKWNIKTKEPIGILVYLFTVAERGKAYLRERRINPDAPGTERKILSILDDFETDSLPQLYGRIELNKVLAEMVLMRLKSVDVPYILVETNNPLEEITDVFERFGLKVERTIKGEGKVSVYVTPGRYWSNAIDMAMEGLRVLDGVDDVQFVYRKGQTISMDFQLQIDYKDTGKVRESLDELFKKLGIAHELYSLSGRKILSFKYNLDVSIKINPEELKSVIAEWLEFKIGREARIRKLDLTVPKDKPPSGGQLATMVLTLFALSPYILGSAGTLGVLGYIILIIADVLVLGYIGYRLYRRIERQRLGNKMNELMKTWQGYEEEPAFETELLEPFFKEHVELPEGIDFNKIIQSGMIRWVAEVKTKVSDTAIEELQYDLQGYRVSVRYQSSVYELFMPFDWSDIAYQVREREFVSLEGAVSDSAIERFRAEVGSYLAGKKPGALNRLVAVPMKERDVIERFCRHNIFAHSVFSRFPKTTMSYPCFSHSRYILGDDTRKVAALYTPRVIHGSSQGVISKPLFRLVGGVDALHELSHGMFDYDEELRDKIVDYFTGNPNRKLEDMIMEFYGHHPERNRMDIVNEEFSYTLSEFAAMSRPWREISELPEIWESQSRTSVEDLAKSLSKRISDRIDEMQYDSSKDKLIQELKEKLVEVVSLWNRYRRWLKGEKVGLSESYVRQRYFEITKEMRDLVIFPPVRLIDVQFFSRVGLIEPWMDPLELGYSQRTVRNAVSFVDREYYLRIIEFLIKRSYAKTPWYKMKSTGKWTEAPFGKGALDIARRLAWELLKSSYGIADLEDLKKFECTQEMFYSAPEVSGILEYVARAELGISLIERLNRFFEQRKENRRRERRLKGFIESINRKDENVIKGIIYQEPWIVQAFFEGAILEEPKALVLDARAFSELDKDNARRLAHLVNQAGGRVAVVSEEGVSEEDIMEKINEFWQRNSIWLSDRARARFGNILDNIYTRGDESNERFARRVYSDIQKKFRINPENIMVFTTKAGFFSMWRNLLKESLFYILYKGNVYLTSKQLAEIQRITGETIISVEPGKSLELLPDRLYNGENWDELAERAPEKSV